MHSQGIPQVDFLLIGGGLASATAAGTLRAAGAEGSIAILSAETTLPYHRPPLSKDFLVKGPDKTNILIMTRHFTGIAISKSTWELAYAGSTSVAAQSKRTLVLVSASASC